MFEREQGILLAPEERLAVKDLQSLCRHPLRFAQRQESSGTSRLLERLMTAEDVRPRWTPVGPFSSHLELACAIRNGRAGRSSC
jgi:molybdate-binding protein